MFRKRSYLHQYTHINSREWKHILYCNIKQSFPFCPKGSFVSLLIFTTAYVILWKYRLWCFWHEVRGIVPSAICKQKGMTQKFIEKLEGKECHSWLTFHLPLITDTFKNFKKKSSLSMFMKIGKIYFFNLNCSRKWVFMILKVKQFSSLSHRRRETQVWTKVIRSL